MGDRGPAAPRKRRALSHERAGVRTEGESAAAAILRGAFAAATDAEPRGAAEGRLLGVPLVRGAEPVPLVRGADLDLTHGFHSYPARFHPRLVRALLSAHARPGMIVCDPFCGSGTTLIEALVAGCRGAGSDLNPLALELSRVKALAPTDPQRALPDELVARAELLATESLARVKARARTKTNGEGWDDPHMYAPHVFRELVGLRELFDEGAPMGALLRRALLLCFSAILVKVSRQPSETAAGTVERAIGKGLPTRMFRRKADALSAGLRALHAIVPAGTPNPTLHKADARKLKHLDDRSVDLVVTSPPYLGTYDYAAHHLRRLGWLGLDAGAIGKHEIGTRRATAAQTPSDALRGWQAELDEVIASIARVLRPDGKAFIVIGDSHVGRLGVAGDRALRIAAERAGLRVVASAAEARRLPSVRGARTAEEHLLQLAR